MKINIGDKITFGHIYCQKTNRKELLNKTIMITPQTFESYNGLYTYDQECPGICLKDYGEPDSIYHLFGNDLEEFYDCILITATPEDLRIIDDMRRVADEAITTDTEAMADYVLGRI